MEGGLLLDVVVGQGASVLQLLPGEDETLLVGRDALLVLRAIIDKYLLVVLIKEAYSLH